MVKSPSIGGDEVFSGRERQVAESSRRKLCSIENYKLKGAMVKIFVLGGIVLLAGCAAVVKPMATPNGK